MGKGYRAVSSMTLHYLLHSGSLTAMLREAPLDARGTFHHAMARGLERWVHFLDEADRADVVTHLVRLVDQGPPFICSWWLLPIHAHPRVWTEAPPVFPCMRGLPIGCAGAFNRRHKRVGNLFQNRHKSIVIEEESSLSELFRWLHLNRARAKIGPGLPAFDRFPWALCAAPFWRPSPNPGMSLGAFSHSLAPRESQAKRAYRCAPMRVTTARRGERPYVDEQVRGSHMSVFGVYEVSPEQMQ